MEATPKPLDLRQKLAEIDVKIEALQKSIFIEITERKKLEKKRKEIEKLTAKADEILSQEP